MAQSRSRFSHRYRPGDWICHNCNNVNFAFRSQCNRCHILKNEEKGFNNALFITNNNGDIPSFSEESKDQSQNESQLLLEEIENSQNEESINNNEILSQKTFPNYKKEFRSYSPNELPSIQPLLQYLKKNDSLGKTTFEFEWKCTKCSNINLYYKLTCAFCGGLKLRKFTA